MADRRRLEDMDAAQQVIELALSRPPTLGNSRLIAIDGPSASGKTTAAARIVAAAPSDSSVLLIHLEDLYAGWSALGVLDETLEALLGPLATGEVATVATWDWATDSPGPERTISSADLVVLEGVGAGHREVADLVTVLVWCTDRGNGVEDALQRDAEIHPSVAADPAAYRQKLEEWQHAQAVHFALDGAETRADVTLG